MKILLRTTAFIGGAASVYFGGWIGLAIWCVAYLHATWNASEVQ